MAKAKAKARTPAGKTGSKTAAKKKPAKGSAKKPAKKAAATTVQKATATAKKATKAVKKAAAKTVKTAAKTAKAATKTAKTATKVVSKAAKTVARTAKRRVVEPVGQALGVTEPAVPEQTTRPAADTSPLADAAAHRAAPHPVTTGTLAAKLLTQPVAAAAELAAESGVGTDEHGHRVG
jgi:hypothetical protein